MVDQEREAPPDQGDGTPHGGSPAIDANAGADLVNDDGAAEEGAPESAGPIDEAIEGVDSGEADGGGAADATDEAAPIEVADEADAGEVTADAEPPSLDASPEPDATATEDDALAAGAGPAEGDAEAGGEALDVDSLDAPSEPPGAGPSADAVDASVEPPASAPAVAPPAGPAPGHLGALRASTPTVGRWLRREARPRPPLQNRYTIEGPEWLEPEFEQQTVEVPSPPLGRSPGRLPAIVVAILMAGVFLLFVLIEPTPMWLLLFGAIMAALGTDGVLRSIRHRVFEREDGRDTVPHIFLPALFALAVPLFIEENLDSYWVVPAALVAGVAFVLVILAEVPAEEAEDDEFHGRARFVSIATTYFVAFALFSLTYTFDLGLRDALVVVALVSVLLAVELIREGEVDPLETLLLAGVVGVVVAEARWVLKYMPIDAYPAGIALVLVFYFVTGMVHAYMTRHINVTVAAEYTIVTVLGLALVVAARATGIA
ncbi:MAG: hypothetical protein AB7L91_04235 [Dehalococcoidia bacterium]